MLKPLGTISALARCGRTDGNRPVRDLFAVTPFHERSLAPHSCGAFFGCPFAGFLFRLLRACTSHLPFEINRPGWRNNWCDWRQISLTAAELSRQSSVRPQGSHRHPIPGLSASLPSCAIRPSPVAPLRRRSSTRLILSQCRKAATAPFARTGNGALADERSKKSVGTGTKGSVDSKTFGPRGDLSSRSHRHFDVRPTLQN